MYKKFYKLKERPFLLTPDPDFLYCGDDHNEALKHLGYGIKQNEGFILITGNVGTGKTTLCRYLMRSLLNSKKFRGALVLNPTLGITDFLRAVLQDFGIEPAGKSKMPLLDQLNKFLLKLFSEGKQAVLVIDESQNLSKEMLEEIRMLSNLETNKKKLLQIIFFGQPELLSQLKSDEMKQLNQRITVRYSLGFMSEQDVFRYIHHRLAVAGDKGRIKFLNGAISKIHRYTKGVPRMINSICERALLAGYVYRTNEITAKIVSRAIDSLEGKKELRKRKQASRAQIAALIFLALSGMVVYYLNYTDFFR